MLAARTESTVQTGRRPGESYARGFFTEDRNGVRVFGHGGTIPGFQAWLDVYPSLDYTVTSHMRVVQIAVTTDDRSHLMNRPE